MTMSHNSYRRASCRKMELLLTSSVADSPARRFLILAGVQALPASVAAYGKSMHNRQVRPRYAIIENVAALLHRGLSDVLSTFPRSGTICRNVTLYQFQPAPAAPHRRDPDWNSRPTPTSSRRTWGKAIWNSEMGFQGGHNLGLEKPQHNNATRTGLNTACNRMG